MPVASANQGVLDIFASKRKSDRLAHAYLLIAPKGAGKLDTALEIAKLVNCTANQKTPCGVCASCLKIQGGNHPDVLISAKGEDSVKIEHIRTLLSRAQLRAYEAAYKVFIIPDAERMTTEAANAFLKTLEEPAKDTLMILTTSQPQVLLDTIKSRCQWVRFSAISRAMVVQSLMESGSDAVTSDYLANYADGWLPLADKLRIDGFYARKQDLIETFITRGLSDDNVKEWADDKDSAKEAIDVFLTLVRDAFVYQATQDDLLLLNRDNAKHVKILAERSPEDLMMLLNQAKQIKHQIDENLNPKMAWGLLKERLWKPLSR